MEVTHLEIYFSHVLFKRVDVIGWTVGKKTEYNRSLTKPRVCKSFQIWPTPISKRRLLLAATCRFVQFCSQSVLQCHRSAPRVGRTIHAESITPTLAVSKSAITWSHAMATFYFHTKDGSGLRRLSTINSTSQLIRKDEHSTSASLNILCSSRAQPTYSV